MPHMPGISANAAMRVLVESCTLVARIKLSRGPAAHACCRLAVGGNPIPPKSRGPPEEKAF